MISRQQRFSLYVIVPVLLGVWMDVSSGQSIQLIPQYPLIQGSVTLSLTGITGKIQNIAWNKEKTDSTNQILNYFPGPEPTTIKGPLFRDGMSVSPDGFLIISSLTKADEGTYIARIQTVNATDIRVYLKIYEKVGKPTITASTSNPIETSKVTLTCTSTNAERILWSRVPSETTLSSDNKTITFSSIKRSDAGDYSCTAANPASEENSDPFKITVAYGPENVNIIVKKMTASAVSLECSADSVPPSTYKWRLNGTDLNGDKNPLEVDQTKDEGNYTCVATNSVTKNTATSSTYVNATIESSGNINNDPTPDSKGLIIGVVIASVILVMILVGSLVYLFVIQKRRKKNATSKTSTTNGKNSTRNGQTIPSTASPEQPELQYADIVFSNNRPKRPQPAPETVYANRTDLARPQEVVYVELKRN